MSHEDVELVRHSFERFVATGEPAWDTLHEEIEVQDHDILDAGEYRGHAGFGRWLEDWQAGLPVYSWELQEFIDVGDQVVVVLLLKAMGRGSNVAVERQDAMACEMRDGRIVRIDYYNSRDQALKSVGLEE
jgi:ketosteroid isomerase-like protein